MANVEYGLNGYSAQIFPSTKNNKAAYYDPFPYSHHIPTDRSWFDIAPTPVIEKHEAEQRLWDC